MANQTDPWGREYSDAEQRLIDTRATGFTGPIDQDGHAVMSRTDNKGRPLDLTARGASGRGTPDEGFAARWPKRGKR